MSTMKNKADEILNEKNTKIIPENIKDGVQIFDITGTLETSNVKLYNTVAEMNSDNNVQDGDLAVVYGNVESAITSTSQFNKVKFPREVVLQTAYQNMANISFESVNMEDYFQGNASLEMFSFSFSGYGSSSEVHVYYTSQDGITYTRTDNGAEIIDIGCLIHAQDTYNWDSIIGNFMILINVEYNGFYKAVTHKDLEKLKGYNFTYNDAVSYTDYRETRYNDMIKVANNIQADLYSDTSIYQDYNRTKNMCVVVLFEDSNPNNLTCIVQSSTGIPTISGITIRDGIVWIYGQTSSDRWLHKNFIYNYDLTNDTFTKQQYINTDDAWNVVTDIQINGKKCFPFVYSKDNASYEIEGNETGRATISWAENDNIGHLTNDFYDSITWERIDV